MSPVTSHVRKAIIFIPLLLAIELLLTVDARANTIFSAAEFKSFCERHETADPNGMRKTMGGFYDVYARQTVDDSSRIVEPSTSDLASIIRKGIELNWGPLELFTSKAFTAGGACRFFLDRQSLAAIDEVFDLHSLWMIKIPTDNGPRQLMKYLLVGNGRLVVGYDLQTKLTLKVPDYPLHTGKYVYQPYTSMAIVNNPQSRGLYNIKVRKSAGAKATSFIGPLFARIKSMQAAGNEIIVHYKLGVSGIEKVQRIPMEERGQDN